MSPPAELRLINFCMGCVRPVLPTTHCGRPTVRMYSIDLAAGGADVTTGRVPGTPEPDEVLMDPEAPEPDSECEEESS